MDNWIIALIIICTTFLGLMSLVAWSKTTETVARIKMGLDPKKEDK